MVIKPLSNAIHISTANTVYNATAVLIVNDGTSATVAIANTAEDDGSGLNGSGSASIQVPENGMLIIRKRPNDTVTASGGANTVFATKVSDTGN